MKLEVEQDEERQIMTVNGVEYSYGVFLTFENPDPDALYRIHRDKDTGVVLITKLTAEDIAELAAWPELVEMEEV